MARQKTTLGKNYIHDSAAGLTYGLYGQASHSYASAQVDWTLSATEAEASYLVATLAGGAVNAILTTAIPGKMWIFYNNSGQTVTFKVSGQSGVAITDGHHQLLFCGAADITAVVIT